MSKEILGHINCPHCGYENGMRITVDKSGAPFGYCEADCNGQMRIGGNPGRVAKFYAKYPNIKRPGAEEHAHQPNEPEKIAPKKAAPVIEPAPVKVPAKKSLFEQLSGAVNG